MGLGWLLRFAQDDNLHLNAGSGYVGGGVTVTPDAYFFRAFMGMDRNWRPTGASRPEISDPEFIMKNDPYFKFLVATILAAVVLALINPVQAKPTRTWPAPGVEHAHS